MWWIGDWLRFGEGKWGEKYADAIEVTGKPYQTLVGAKHVAERFELLRRRNNLSWSHHREVAALPTDSADIFLEKAEHEGWSRNELRQHVNRAKASAAITAADPSS